jgi:toxin ParE1/3/4
LKKNGVLRLVWRPKARAQLRAILDYIGDRDLIAAERLDQAIERTVETARAHPLIYRPGRIDGTREAVVTPNYIVIYRIVGDSLVVTTVLHTRQRYP